MSRSRSRDRRDTLDWIKLGQYRTDYSGRGQNLLRLPSSVICRRTYVSLKTLPEGVDRSLIEGPSEKLLILSPRLSVPPSVPSPSEYPTSYDISEDLSDHWSVSPLNGSAKGKVSQEIMNQLIGQLSTRLWKFSRFKNGGHFQNIRPFSLLFWSLF